MQQDIREMMKGYQEENVELSSNHSKNFEALLHEEMHSKSTKRNFKWIPVAASILLLVSIGLQFFPEKENVEINSASKEISLGTISPEFNTIETYYTNSINLEITQLEITDENKEIIDGYLLKIAELTKEYKSLTKELNTKGVNDATIDALISNLQLRLQLLKRLKKQLTHLQNLNTKQDETQII